MTKSMYYRFSLTLALLKPDFDTNSRALENQPCLLRAKIEKIIYGTNYSIENLI